MATDTGTSRCAAEAPASTSTRRISSVAYATEDSASDENTASATVLDRRSWCACARDIGLPTTHRFSRLASIVLLETSVAHGGSAAPRMLRSEHALGQVSSMSSRILAFLAVTRGVATLAGAGPSPVARAHASEEANGHSDSGHCDHRRGRAIGGRLYSSQKHRPRAHEPGRAAGGPSQAGH